jgi:glycosyltransferase involved in cell wall biosynthesis
MPELRVGFNCYLLNSRELRGWGRYTVNLLAKLPEHGIRPILYSNAPIHPTHLQRLPCGTFEVEVSEPMRYSVWQNLWLPRRLKSDHVDLFHSPMNYGLPFWAPCPKVLTLHDAIDQVYYLPKTTWRNRLRPEFLRSSFEHWTARRYADHIITVSQHARDDLVSHLRLPLDKITVIYEAADPALTTTAANSAQSPLDDRIRSQTAGYFFYVGGFEDRKNVSFLLEAFAAAELPETELLLAGSCGIEHASLNELARKLGIDERLRFLGFVPDHDLVRLYQNAIAFIYPSKYEGFGLQLTEAMSLGTPVLAARASCLPEILGDGGRTFSLDGPDELVQLMTRVAIDSTFRTTLSEHSRSRSRSFSWDITARDTAAVYRALK